MCYPDNCIKGIPNQDFILPDGTIGAHLFHFKEVNKRDDNFIEQSINWQDDDNAINFTLKQKKDGDKQFKNLSHP